MRRRVRPAVVLVVALTSILLAHGEANAAAYVVTVIADIPGGGSETVGHGLNNSGTVVGSTATGAGSPQAFVWSAGVTTDLGGVYFTDVAYDINDSGTIAGNGYPNPGKIFRYSAGTFTDLNGLPISGGLGQSDRAWGINASGWIAGSSVSGNFPGAGIGYAALWIGSSPTAICAYGVATAVNDSGTAVGWGCGSPGFVWSFADGVTPLDGAAFDVSNAGIVAGIRQGDICNQAAFWTAGVATVITPNACGEANAINEAGAIVGIYRQQGEDDSPFIWTPADGLRLLNLLVAPSAFIRLREAVDINEAGQILVNGQELVGDSWYPRTFLLTPIPIPATLWLFPAGISALLGLRRRRRA